MTPRTQSPFERRAYAYIERGYSVIPIAPGTKRPGEYIPGKGWRGMADWTKYANRLPTQDELDLWYTWPDAGIGLLCGKLSGIVGLDRDYNTNGTDALDAIIPYTPVKKKGAKGWTGFYQYQGEKSCSFNVGGMRVMDVLSDGRQTLMPGTLHPEGHTYIYLTDDILEDFEPTDLPKLPPDFFAQVARTLAPYQDATDKVGQAKTTKAPETAEKFDTDLSPSAQYFKSLNQNALAQLDNWVPKLIKLAKNDGEGYRTVATWRDCKNPNISINPKGIMDWGGNYGMTPIDLVMNALGVSFNDASDMLRTLVIMPEVVQIEMTVGGKSSGAKKQPPAPKASAVMPWHKPSATAAPVVLMLPPSTSFDAAPAVPQFLANPPGILGVIARWITATAPKSQPELSVAAAVALASVIMGRTYRSQHSNFTSLYVVMVAMSTEGKEHPQGCVNSVLTAAGLENLIGGSGYTSAGAVYSALLKSPVHLATIDEIGKLLKSSRAQGNANSEAAIDKMIEAFGRMNGILRPPTYSSMTVKMADKPADHVIHNPAISLLGATTPGTFYGNLTDDLIKDGFLGRCIVVESHQPRQCTNFVESTPPPQEVIDWCKKVYVTGQIEGNLVGISGGSDKPATTIELRFDDGCKPMFTEFERELISEKKACEVEGLDVLLGRTLEKAMKLSMIACKAENHHNKSVRVAHFEWAKNYVRHYDTALIRSVREKRYASDDDQKMQKIMEAVKNAHKTITPSTPPEIARMLAAGRYPHSSLLKKMHMKKKEFEDLVDTLKESGQLDNAWGTTEWDYAGKIYFIPE